MIQFNTTRVDPEKSLKIGIIGQTDFADFQNFTEKWFRVSDEDTIVEIQPLYKDKEDNNAGINKANHIHKEKY
jgi:hypothetical protein